MYLKENAKIAGKNFLHILVFEVVIPQNNVQCQIFERLILYKPLSKDWSKHQRLLGKTDFYHTH